MDISLLSKETTAKMEVQQLKDFVDDFEVAKFLKDNQLAADIAGDLLQHNVISIEVEAWRRTINEQTGDFPVVIFILDNIQKLFEVNTAAQQAYRQRLSEKERVSISTTSNIGLNYEAYENWKEASLQKGALAMKKKQQEETRSEDKANLAAAETSKTFEMDNNQQIIDYKEQLRKEGSEIVKKHIDALNGEIKAFLSREKDVFSNRLMDSFENVSVSFHGQPQQLKLTKDAVAKLYSEDGEVADRYRSACATNLREYKKDLKAQCEKHLAEIEHECRLVLQEHGHRDAPSEDQLIQTIHRARDFNPMLPALGGETGTAHMTESFFKDQMQQNLQSFDEHIKREANEISTQLHQPMRFGQANVGSLRNEDEVAVCNAERLLPEQHVGGVEPRPLIRATRRGQTSIQRRFDQPVLAPPINSSSPDKSPAFIPQRKGSVRNFSYTPSMLNNNTKCPAPVLASADSWHEQSNPAGVVHHSHPPNGYSNEQQSTSLALYHGHPPSSVNQANMNSTETTQHMDVVMGSIDGQEASSSTEVKSHGEKQTGVNGKVIRSSTTEAKLDGKERVDTNSTKESAALATKKHENPEASELRNEKAAPGANSVQILRRPSHLREGIVEKLSNPVVLEEQAIQPQSSSRVSKSQPNEQDMDPEFLDPISPPRSPMRVLSSIPPKRLDFLKMCAEQEQVLSRIIREPRPMVAAASVDLQAKVRGRSISEILGAKKRKRDQEDDGREA